MPVTPTYPGVYIEEVPSGVRTITSVATSTTAFLGRAKRGEINEPTTIFNYGDFERFFGGLDVDYPMSYSVRDFFVNGGGEAIVVRLYKGHLADGADPAADPPPTPLDGLARVEHDTLKLVAASPGEWGNYLRLSLNKVGITPDVADRFDLDVTDLFNVIITDVAGGGAEQFNNVTFKDTSRRVDRILEQSSSLVRLDLEENEVVDPDTAVPSDVPLPDDDPTKDESKHFEDGLDSDDLDTSAYKGSGEDKTGLYALEKADIFNLLCIPPDKRNENAPNAVYQEAMTYCVKRRAMLIVDPPNEWELNKARAAATAKGGLDGLGLKGMMSRNAALYFPRVKQADPLRDGQIDTFVPCGIVAGIMAQTDVSRGVWKAPAGIDAALNGIRGLSVNLTDQENGVLNPLGINCLRSFPVIGNVVWGARTLRGADLLADEYKYVPVRRLALFIEESLFRGTQWVVFEPNDEPLWAQIRLNVGAFMHNLFRQGAFQGASPKEAYLVKCDKETTTQNDIDRGIVNIVVGFAPLKPAEFVIIKIQQLVNQSDF
ncbi:MAG: phage tail sheath family protein [Chloroflexi bacterium]|nr:phage tail sheath family protein [Chloroflexota bacterium]